MYNTMSDTKSKTIAFRVTQQDFTVLTEIATRLHKMGQANHSNPHLLAKEYAFAMANIVMKMNGWTQASEQDQAVFALAKGMAETMNPNQQQGAPTNG
jgi:hypothetical protein